MTITIISYIAVFIIGSWVGYHTGVVSVIRELTPRERIINEMQNYKGEKK